MTSVASLRIVLSVFALTLATCARAEPVRVMRAQDALNGIGVATHFNYMDGAYAHPDKAAEALNYLGITHLRDQTPTPWVGGSSALSTYQALMDKGFHFDFIALGGNFDFETTAQQLRALEDSHPGMIDAVEGFNEVDHTSVSYNGQTGIPGAKAAQGALYSAIRKDPRLGHLPVYDLTGADWPEPGMKRADFANAHLYAQNGNPPAVWFNGAADETDKRGLDLVVTEFGYASNPQSGWLVIGVDERTQAKGLLLGLFNGYTRKVNRTYIYELVDQKPDPLMTEKEQHFGLFRVDYQPKVSAIALHNLTTLLRDDSPNADHFKADSVNMDLGRVPPSVHILLISKSSGARLVAIWHDTAFWDRASGTPIENPPVRTPLSLPTGYQAVALYDPLISARAIKTYDNTTQLTLDVPDHPILLEMAPR